ncbi:peptidylprolyl cistrans isomerase [Seminavis robusta]|uniref:peptidylprolyl isomerase n=1 Tax=Seminavis robusta TaxID=568900 RepID=A0A9N8EY74_9STRA|nr:peptidylprolyl cistrans isomerase [Seminavis robusta]|eukprot:Sro2248_g320660.1 peptidylprolyl cistrans isomerase (257) ;mRNA; r:2188-3051
MKMLKAIVTLGSLISVSNCFVLQASNTALTTQLFSSGSDSLKDCQSPSHRATYSNDSSRRQNLQKLAFLAASLTLGGSPAIAEDYEARNAQRQYIQESYADFTKTKEGWLYRQVKPGSGDKAQEGDRVVFDWSGYTIGYFGRPFQAKGGPQGGAFDKDIDFERTIIGSGKLIKGLELALNDMQTNEVRQVVIPYGALSYPEGDPSHEKVGPKPSTFSGMRALDFVLDNPRLDRTLLFNVKVIRVDKANGKGGFIRG